MAKRRISVSDIIIGQPLPWNVFNGDGMLLLRAGEMVASEAAVKRMVAEGLYSDVSDVRELEEVVFVKGEPSVVRILNRANWFLRKALPGLSALSDAAGKVNEIAELIYSAIELSPEVAVACIFLNQKPGGPYNFRHNTDTAIVAALVAQAMGKSKEEIITGIAAALTANLGMLDYQEHLDNKKGPLDQAEKDHIRTHPAHSVEMLENVGVTNKDWLSYVQNHHENEDGSGYPSKKLGSDIPTFAKLIGLADRYCARVTSKDYRKQSLASTALKSIFLSKNKEIDPALAPYFIKTIGLYPPGTFVRLKSYEVAVVSKNGDTPDAPNVFVVLTAHGMPQGGRIARRTSDPQYAVTEAVDKEIAGSNLAMQRFWGDVAAF
ncbi:MAG TPA: HD domain-containing phosphohydrolase [Methylophilaceae bacterium]|jgi:HD-GYP domain-containing protein (c-di-GMP phosphodiesterase class II)